MYSKLNLFEIGELDWEDNPDINYYRTGELDYLQIDVNSTTLPLVNQLRDLLFDSIITLLRDLEGVVENIGNINIVPRRIANLDETETTEDIETRKNLELFKNNHDIGIVMGIIVKLDRNSVTTNDIFEYMDFFEVIFEVAGMSDQPHYSSFDKSKNLSSYSRDVLWKLLYAVFYYNHIVHQLNIPSWTNRSQVIIALNNKELQISLLTYLFRGVTINKSLCNLLDNSQWIVYVDYRGLTSSLNDDSGIHLISENRNYISSRGLENEEAYFNNVGYLTLAFLDTLPQ